MKLEPKHIIVGITGGIAAYKSATLVRQLIKRGMEVQVIMTPNAKEFITPLTLSTLTNKPVISEFFTANTGQWNSHVDLGLWADMMVIAPATASTIGKMTTGVADNMLVTTYLSAKCPVIIAPAMDLDMWAHPTTQRNLETLKKDGVKIIEPQSGELASHLIGKGRMAEPEEIAAYIEAELSRSNSLGGKKILITAGPTYENIDPVRFIGNYSSGKMGFALAKEAASRGAEVVLISGPVNLTCTDKNIKKIDVVSASEMLQACEKEFPECDAAVLCAAVADYAPDHTEEKKIKREGKQEIILKLKRNPDIAASLGVNKADKILIGFALETHDEISNAQKKLQKKNLDWIVLNSVNDELAGFGKDTNKITLINRKGDIIPYPAKNKSEVAADILDAVFGKRRK